MSVIQGLARATFTNTTISETVEKVEEPDMRVLFQQAVTDGWNLEYEWLWLASRLNSDARRGYCFQQALRINPYSDLARQGLKSLKRSLSN